ncbi:hypothetical protein P7K49_032074 [Saguinus oedipus]|uniref:Uncharacterized protein n=1 Tax=Saguinus oedipus TaxID=9490 RepID=A0ABQ9TYF9_SAGOE|nr:hypothetical protein P7K49_032074 [Saguinus oedipus]
MKETSQLGKKIPGKGIQGKTQQGKAGQFQARQFEVRKGKKKQGNFRQGRERQCGAIPGKTLYSLREGKTRLFHSRQEMAIRG